ncbi:MAG: sensor histidine kinase [Puniceicoccaceae bacterium]
MVQALLRPGAGEDSHYSAAFSNLFAHAPDPVLLFSPSGEMVAKNDRASVFWNGGADFLPASVLDEVIRVGRDGKCVQCSKKSQIIEIPSTRGRRFFLPTVFPLFSEAPEEDPRKNLVVCILKDETDWARSEIIRNNLLSSIHHELNTPLTSARVGLYLLAEQQIGLLNEVQAELVDRAKEDLDREIATIQNVLALMRSDSIVSTRKGGGPADLHEVLEEVMLELQELTQSLRLTINRFYSEASPMIGMERETVRLITKQIFSCVIKHVEKGAVVDVVTINEEEDCFLKLISSDPALVDALPDNLFSLPIESEDMRGVKCVDLGLRVAREIVREHGGDVSATRNPEAALLTLRFPCAPEPRDRRREAG